MPRVLLIETSATLRQILRRLLIGRGFNVVTAANLVEGVQQLDSANLAAEFDAVVFPWSPDQRTQAQELIHSVARPPLLRLAALAITPSDDAGLRAALGMRARTGVLLRDHFGTCAERVSELLQAAPPTAAVHTAAAEPIRILLVDDAATARAAFSRLLRRHGYHVELAAGTQEALALAARSPFDIAIVDYFMPDGNGDALCRQLRANPLTANITTAIFTATYSDAVIKDALEAGAVECMFKNEADALFLARLDAMSRTIRVHKSVDAERSRLEGILSSVGDGVYGVDENGGITFINPAARRILGFGNRAPLVGQSAHGLFHHTQENGKPNAPTYCVLQQAYRAGTQMEKWETIFWHHGGKPVPVECTVFPLRIAGRLEGSVVGFRDISERKQMEYELRWQAHHDPLTKLINRRYFEKQLEAEVSRLKRSTECSALLYLDLDRFKYINDTAGHAAGDQLLVAISQQLQSRLRESDILARLGGDEFAVIQRNIDVNNPCQGAEAFRELLEKYDFHYEGKHYKINGSIGVALVDQNTLSPGDALANADIACHIAKGKGRNQTHLYLPENDEKIAMDLELGWSVRLQNALQNDAFTLFYQPIVAMEDIDWRKLPSDDNRLWEHLRDTNTISGTQYEVLLRLTDSRGDIVSPNAFLPTAERFNLMEHIDHWVLARAIRQLAQLSDADNATFMINLSGPTLDAGFLTPVVKRLLGEYRLAPERLIFEITETSAIANLDAAKRLINELRALGCRFALDDFGSGFCSFAHLKHLPVDFIKIDGQFVRDMATDPADYAIVNSINDIAHAFGKKTIAESVENAETLRLLHRCGIDYAQGFYVARPERQSWEPGAPPSIQRQLLSR